jgi:preprotein translocase subunit SecE
MATETRESTPQPATGGAGARSGRGNRRTGPVRRYRETVAELRKVIYPGRNELITYVIVVLVFVVFFTAFVSSLDYGLTKAVLAIFA